MESAEATTAEGCVAKGARLLDNRVPGWETRIDRANLKMRHVGRCILGQLYGDYNTGRSVLNLTPDQGEEFGFDLPRTDYLRPDDDWIPLEIYWCDEIDSRLLVTAGMVVVA